MVSAMQRSVVLRPLCKASHPQLAAGQIRTYASISKDLPPESPGYIDVPQPPQLAARPPPIVKGVLPRIKPLFKPRPPVKPATPQRGTRVYYNRTIPEAKASRPQPTGKDKEFVEYKNRMTDLRRHSLLNGMIQLRRRYKRTMEGISRKSKAKQQINYENLMRPEREDDRLTSSTVLPTIEQPPTPLSDEDIAAKRARWEAKEQERAETQRNELHTLYSNARDFIVTEEQLNAKINEVFDDPFFQNENDPSIWAKEGVPENIRAIVNQQHGGNLSTSENFTMITRQRLQAIAEELTGGKMESEERIDKRAGRKRL